jgi:hypothetical protein
MKSTSEITWSTLCAPIDDRRSKRAPSSAVPTLTAEGDRSRGYGMSAVVRAFAISDGAPSVLDGSGSALEHPRGCRWEWLQVRSRPGDRRP